MAARKDVSPFARQAPARLGVVEENRRGSNPDPKITSLDDGPYDVRPEYPTTTKLARVEGTVILEATISPDGQLTHIRVLKSTTLLDEAAVDAVEQRRYEATTLNAISVPIVMTVTVTFALG